MKTGIADGIVYCCDEDGMHYKVEYSNGIVHQHFIGARSLPLEGITWAGQLAPQSHLKALHDELAGIYQFMAGKRRVEAEVLAWMDVINQGAHS